MNPSYLWRSILSAQDAIKVACRRRIGDGTSTKVWKVPWLPCAGNGYVSTNLVPELQNINVQNLMDIDKTNTWDNDVLDDLFNDRDRQLIPRVPISFRRRCDAWFWLFDPKGQFTVRSMYKKLQGPHEMVLRSLWHQLWNLKIPSKVACFLWPVCKGCLPTMLALMSKLV